MTALDVPLSTDEAAQLAECEATIRNGLQTFVEVGQSLARIRDGRLYRQTHTTFEAYCDQEFGLTYRRVNQIIAAAEVTDALGTIVPDSLPANEGQARELSGLAPETAAEVMRQAHDATDGKPTAAAIAEARQEVAPKPSRFTKVRSEALVDKETGEVIDPSTPPPGYTTENPAAIAAQARREFYAEPWPVFTTKLLPALKHWTDWYGLDEIDGAAGILASLDAMPVRDGDEEDRAIQSLDRAAEWIAELRTALAQHSRKLRSVQ